MPISDPQKSHLRNEEICILNRWFSKIGEFATNSEKNILKNLTKMLSVEQWLPKTKQIKRRMQKEKHDSPL